MIGATLKTQTDWDANVYADNIDENGYIRFGSFTSQNPPTESGRFAVSCILINDITAGVFYNEGSVASPNFVPLTGGGGGGITSINGDTTAAQTITGTGGINVSTSSGITTIDGSSISANPGGVNTNVQYNNNGVFGGDDDFIYVTGRNPIFSVGDLVLSGNSQFINLDDGNSLIQLNSPSGTTKIGDTNGISGLTQFEVIDPNGQVLTTVSGIGGLGGFVVQDTNTNYWFDVDPSFSLVTSGDVLNRFNLTKSIIDDANEAITMQAAVEFKYQLTNGSRYLYISGGQSFLGDLDDNLNHTLLLVDDPNQLVTITSQNGLIVQQQGDAIWLNIDPNTLTAGMGDLSGEGNNTSIFINDPAMSITNTTNGVFTIQDIYSQEVFSASTGMTNQIVTMGDVSGVNLLTTFQVNDPDQTINATLNGTFLVQNTNLQQSLNVDTNVFYFSAGDVQFNANGTSVTVDDSTMDITLQAANDITMLNPDGVPWFQMATQSGLNRVYVGDFNANFNHTVMTVDDASQNVDFQLGHNFIISDTLNRPWFETVISNHTTTIGDVGGTFNLTTLVVDDMNNNVIVYADSGFIVNDSINGQASWLSIEPAISSAAMGDVGFAFGGTSIYVLDGISKSITMQADEELIYQDTNSNVFFEINQSSKTVFLGDASGSWGTGTGIKINVFGSDGTIVIGDIVGNNTNFKVDQNNEILTFANSLLTILTANLSTSTIQMAATHLNNSAIQQFANNAAAIAGGLNVGDEYYTNVAGDGIKKIVI